MFFWFTCWCCFPEHGLLLHDSNSSGFVRRVP
jgi:hypothetical protein